MRLWELRSGVSLFLLVIWGGCAMLNERPRISYTHDQFRTEVRERVPELAAQEIPVLFEVDRRAIALARAVTDRAPRGHPRIVALVDMLHEPPPQGLGLRYKSTTTQNAAETLKLGEGNCVALASVFVGLGRGLGWPVYFGEALIRDEEIRREEDLAIRADHMVVVIVAQTVKAVVDFTGPVEGYGVNVIDDIHAYAHLLNNQASERILADMENGGTADWEGALEGFSLATKLMPEMARGWNNRGVALARLGRLDAARDSYARALQVDASMGSPQQNLVVLETRSRGTTSIQQQPTNR